MAGPPATRSGRSYCRGMDRTVEDPAPPGMSPHQIVRGRANFPQRSWGEEYSTLLAADAERGLEPRDVARLAVAAYLLGRDAESEELLARAHKELARHGDTEQAARSAFWLAFQLFTKGEVARGGGWLARARRLVEDHPGCVEQGYVLVPDALHSMRVGDLPAALETFARAGAIGDRFNDPDLTALARLGQGQTLVMLGRIDTGVALLDEAMVAVTAGEVSPIITGVVYCATIEACSEIFDLRRAQEWTAALKQWCASHPDLVPFRGQCLVRHAEILQLHGAWQEAIQEFERGREALQHRGDRAAGSALYQLGELHRLRGAFADAEEAYRLANELGRPPQPGLAQLRLAQGRLDTATAAIRGALEETRNRRRRSGVLAAAVEILLAADDIATARAAADELSNVASELNSPFLRAVASQAVGAVLLEEGDASGASAALREAWVAWRELAAPYEAARTRVLLGLACRALGDADAADLELDAARRVFQSLGAAPDLNRLRALRGKAAGKGGRAGTLTSREVEVLRLVAAGRTNRMIAGDLDISEKTVARHVSNIFTKLDLSSRAAATAYAYTHDLV